MLIVESPCYDPYINLALEEYLFTNLEKGASCCMLWQNDNTIVLGNYQNAAEEINMSYVREHKIKVARRLSGGGAVYHDLQNLNYTFITDKENIETVSFETFVLPLVRVLRKLGLNASFSGRNDVIIDGRKICGNSQKISRGRILHHGCIMLGTDLSVVGQALRPKRGRIASRSTKSVRAAVTTINACLDQPLSIEAFKRLLINEISSGEELIPYSFTMDEITEIIRLSETKYRTWEWNFGKAPAYELQREKKFPAGFVSVRMQVEKGMIKGIRFYGDFFANRELHMLENALAGSRLDKTLSETLERLQADTYIKGIDNHQLYGLIMME